MLRARSVCRWESRSDCWGEVSVSRGHLALGGQCLGKQIQVAGAGSSIVQAPLSWGQKGMEGQLSKEVVDGRQDRAGVSTGSLCARSKWGSRRRSSTACAPDASTPSTASSTRKAGSGLKQTVCCLGLGRSAGCKGPQTKAGGLGPAQPRLCLCMRPGAAPLKPPFPTCRKGTWYQHAAGGVRCGIPGILHFRPVEFREVNTV